VLVVGCASVYIPAPHEANPVHILYHRNFERHDMNRIYQTALKIAYRLALVYWFLFRPTTFGVHVAVWQNERILIIKNSYRDYCTLPGGYMKRGEDPKAAATRECAEEVSLQIQAEQLTAAGEFFSDKEYKKDTVIFFEANLAQNTEFEVDAREVVWGKFLHPSEALSLNLSGIVRRYLNERQRDG